MPIPSDKQPQINPDINIIKDIRKKTAAKHDMGATPDSKIAKDLQKRVDSLSIQLSKVNLDRTAPPALREKYKKIQALCAQIKQGIKKLNLEELNIAIPVASKEIPVASKLKNERIDENPQQLALNKRDQSQQRVQQRDQSQQLDELEYSAKELMKVLLDREDVNRSQMNERVANQEVENDSVGQTDVDKDVDILLKKKIFENDQDTRKPSKQ